MTEPARLLRKTSLCGFFDAELPWPLMEISGRVVIKSELLKTSLTDVLRALISPAYSLRSPPGLHVVSRPAGRRPPAIRQAPSNRPKVHEPSRVT